MDYWGQSLGVSDQSVYGDYDQIDWLFLEQLQRTFGYDQSSSHNACADDELMTALPILPTSDVQMSLPYADFKDFEEFFAAEESLMLQKNNNVAPLPSTFHDHVDGKNSIVVYDHERSLDHHHVMMPHSFQYDVDPVVLHGYNNENVKSSDFYVGHGEGINHGGYIGLGATKLEVGQDCVLHGEEDKRGGGRKNKSCMLELEEIQKHFNVPISRAAKELNVGVTVLKKRCRELGIMRWPHRKLKSLNCLIKNVKELGVSRREIVMLEEHKRMVEILPDMELSERAKKLRQACFKANYKKRRHGVLKTH